MTRQEIVDAVRTTACTLVRQRGLSDAQACRVAARAVLRAAGMAVPAGLGAGAPSSPGAPAAASSAAPTILADVSAAGDSPAVVAMRDMVSKWSWLIPVGGILMSAKSKFSSWVAPKNDPFAAANRSLRAR